MQSSIGPLQSNQAHLPRIPLHLTYILKADGPPI